MTQNMTQDMLKKNTEVLGKEKPALLSIRSRKWFITKHDYLEKHINSIKELKAIKWAFCKEICPTTGRKHIHVFLSFKNAVKLGRLKKVFGDADIKKCKGNDNQNLLYIMKDGNYESSFEQEEPEWEPNIISIDSLRPWQEKLMEKLKTRADDLTIMWYWDEKGGAGKTAMVKLLLTTRKCIMVGGRQEDVINGLDNYYEDKKKYPQIILVNLPRSYTKVNYPALELIKDGVCVNTKYKSRFHIFANPHVIVFANRPPVRKEMTENKWDIVCLD